VRECADVSAVALLVERSVRDPLRYATRCLAGSALFNLVACSFDPCCQPTSATVGLRGAVRHGA
jgi:hypothetical protein